MTHTERAIVKYQERGDKLATVAQAYLDMDRYEQHRATYFQRASAIEYATARKLMGVE